MKNLFNTIKIFLIAAALIGLTVIFPMIYDLHKAGKLNLFGIIEYVGMIVVAFIIAAFIRGN